jgi:hypothetical protein
MYSHQYLSKKTTMPKQLVAEELAEQEVWFLYRLRPHRIIAKVLFEFYFSFLFAWHSLPFYNAIKPTFA